MSDSTSRHSFLQTVGLGTAALGLSGSASLNRSKSRSRVSRKRPPIRMLRKGGSLSPTARSAWALSDMAPATSAPSSHSRTTRMSTSWPSVTCFPIGVPHWQRRVAAKKPIRPSKNLSKTTRLRPYSWPPTLRAMRGTVSKSSSTASTSLAPSLQSTAHLKTPTSCSRQSSRVVSST